MRKNIGHLIFEAPGLRAVAIPRDRRVSPKCYHCALFTQRPGNSAACPVDREGRKVCDTLGISWKRIARPAAISAALEAAAERRAQG